MKQYLSSSDLITEIIQAMVLSTGISMLQLTSSISRQPSAPHITHEIHKINKLKGMKSLFYSANGISNIINFFNLQ